MCWYDKEDESNDHNYQISLKKNICTRGDIFLNLFPIFVFIDKIYFIIKSDEMIVIHFLKILNDV